MMRKAAFAIAVLLASAPALAGVRSSAADGFTIVHEAYVARPAAQQWAALIDWGGWWPDAHTYSGKASNLELEIEADGELEEEWDGGVVLHGSVLQAQTDKLLRLSAALGPLQALPVTAILDVALKPEGSGTRVVMTYRVGSPASADAARFAAPVDAVLAEAFGRLIRHVAPLEDPKTEEKE
jgi:uncharacterized protein YndB with AHSA1/START domain